MLGPFATASRRTPNYHSPGVATVVSHAACASMSTTTTTMHDRGDRYVPMEWAQKSPFQATWDNRWHWSQLLQHWVRHQLTLHDGHRSGASALHRVSVYTPAFACTKLYCLVTEAHECEQLPQACYSTACDHGLNLQSESPVWCLRQ